jgi:guanine deaminase
VDEGAILAEIGEEFRALAARFDEAEASVAPVLEAVERIWRRGLATAIPADTYPARLA